MKRRIKLLWLALRDWFLFRKKLESENRRLRKQVMALTSWIRATHRLDRIPKPGTIKEILQASKLLLLLCACSAAAQPLPIRRNPATTNLIPPYISIDSGYGTNTTIVTNLSVLGPSNSPLFSVNGNKFVVSSNDIMIGSGVLGQGKLYGTPSFGHSGYIQPISTSDGNTRLINTGPYNIIMGVDNSSMLRITSPGYVAAGNGVGTNVLHVFGNATVTGHTISSNYLVGNQFGIAATVDVIVAGSTTNRMVYVGGILVSNITGFYSP